MKYLPTIVVLAAFLILVFVTHKRQAKPKQFKTTVIHNEYNPFGPDDTLLLIEIDGIKFIKTQNGDLVRLH